MNLLLPAILLGCFGIRSCQKPRSDLPEACNLLALGLISECLSKIEIEATEIDLSHRGLTFLPNGAFTRFVNLKILDLSFNNLHMLSSEVFTGLSELQSLKLNNNQLEALIGSQLAWTPFLGNIAAVHLGMNPFNCNCSSLWFRDFLTREENVLDMAEVKCLAPLHWNGLLLRDIPTHYDSVCKGTDFGKEFCGATNLFPCTTTEIVNKCIPKSKECDTVNDCINNIDESPFVCNGRQPYVEPVADVVPFKQPPMFALFNGLLDRYHVPAVPAPTSTPQPAFSAVEKPCRNGAFKCYSNVCIPQRAICDGKLDCPDGADEDVVMCVSRATTTRPPPTQSTTPPFILMSTLSIDLNIPDSDTAPFTPVTEGPMSSRSVSSTPISEFLTNLLNSLNVSLSQQKMMEESASSHGKTTTSTTIDESRHPTITFPQINGNQYFNHLMENSFTTEQTTIEPETEPTTQMTVTENTMLADFNSNSVPDKDVYQPQSVRLINLKNNEISVVWDAPGSARAGSWRLVAYSVICEVIRVTPPTKKKKFSPLLSTLVHDYQFHHILPDDSLTITVKALYEDSDHQRYESVSDAFLRPGSEATKSPIQLKKESVAAAQNVNYPGKMGFEDLVGISIGGTLVGLMTVLLAIYFYKRRGSNASHVTLRKVHKRTMRMRKLDRTLHKVNDRTISMEPIYSEPQYAHHEISKNPHPYAVCENKIIEARNDPVALRIQNLAPQLVPDNHYIQVLESDSQYYSSQYCASHPPGCSEYSCYSLAAGKPITIPAKPFSQVSSSESSYAVYDSDNCSMGYYFHNTGVVPRCTHTPAPINPINVKHFGDTLTMCHGSAAPLQQIATVSRQPDGTSHRIINNNVISPNRNVLQTCESENSA